MDEEAIQAIDKRLEINPSDCDSVTLKNTILSKINKYKDYFSILIKDPEIKDLISHSHDLTI